MNVNSSAGILSTYVMTNENFIKSILEEGDSNTSLQEETQLDECTPQLTDPLPYYWEEKSISGWAFIPFKV